jgi:hypothetical protein
MEAATPNYEIKIFQPRSTRAFLPCVHRGLHVSKDEYLKLGPARRNWYIGCLWQNERPSPKQTKEKNEKKRKERKKASWKT